MIYNDDGQNVVDLMSFIGNKGHGETMVGGSGAIAGTFCRHVESLISKVYRFQN